MRFKRRSPVAIPLLVRPQTFMVFCYELFIFERASAERKSGREASAKKVFPQPHPFRFGSFTSRARAGLIFYLACDLAELKKK